MIPLLVLDSNVYISAILFGGKPRLILEAALARRFRLAVSPYILKEIDAVLGAGKFGFSAAARQAVINEISGLAELSFTRIKVFPW